MLDTKVDKVNGESLINVNYIQEIDNPEFIRLCVDSSNHLLQAIKSDGTSYIGGDLQVEGQASISGDVTVRGNLDLSNEFIQSVDNPEYLKVTTDEQGKVLDGIKKDGSHYLYNVQSESIDKKIDKEYGKGLSTNDYTNTDKELVAVHEIVDNPEYIKAEVDSEGKILSGRNHDGTAFENVGLYASNIYASNIYSSNLEVAGVDITDNIDAIDSNTTINDIEQRSEIKTDAENKILSYRDKEGILHENVGIEASNIICPGLHLTNITTVSKDAIVYFERPKFGEFWFYGSLPTDMSEDRIPTYLTVVYKVNGVPQFKCKCTLSIQGHGSAQVQKKGYTFETYNDEWKAISLKFGDMCAADSFHLKGYASDRTHSRGIAGPRLWRSMIHHLPYPYNKFNNIPLNISAGQKTDSFCIADAKYSEDGFPCAVYLNDDILGLYTLKLKKNRKNYGMQKDNKNEIFIDSRGFDVSEGHSARLSDSFDYVAWDLKNPKLKNYEEGGEITDATVLANIERLFYFTNNIATEYENHSDYIVLPHWICWYIFSELVGNRDVDGNNLEVMTWDGQHWSIFPYDLDATVGIHGNTIETGETGLLINYGFYRTFRTCYETEIKALYTELRKSGCITLNNVYQFYIEQTNSIPRSIYEDDLKVWPNSSELYPVIEQVYSYIHSRIDYLDSIWLINE